jgi:hypothetical protein
LDVSATSVAPALGTPPSSYSSGTLMFSELATVYQTNPRGIQYNQISFGRFMRWVLATGQTRSTVSAWGA